MRNLIASLLLCSACLLAAEAPSTVAIRNARVVTVSGPVMNRATVVLRDGLIQDIGENITVPADAWVIDGEGLTVYPGLIDALSTWGLETPAATGANGRGGGGRGVTPATTQPAAPPARGPEDRPRTTSWEKAADMLRPTDSRIEVARSGGFTTAVTFPTRGIFAGQGSVINLAGGDAAQMVIVPSVGQYIRIAGGGGGGGGFPSSLFGVIAYIRQIYIDADYYKMLKAAYAKNPRGMQRPEYDRALEGVIESPRILLPANRKVEVDRMLRFGKELKQELILYGLHEGYREGVAEMVRKAGVPVLVNLRWPERARDTDPEQEDSLRTLELRDKAPSVPATLAKGGVRFAFYSGGIDRPRDIFRAVKKAIDAGLPASDALRAMTLSPAEIYGVADRLGSIEKGKIANLFITNGDLFQDSTQVKYIFVDGKKFDPIPETPAGGRATDANNQEGAAK